MAGAAPLALVYLLYFGAVGIILPFLPAYLHTLGLSAAEIGMLLALQPLVSLFAPTLWGHLADRTGRPDRVLALVTLGAAAGFAPLLYAGRFGAIVATVAVYAFFATAITTLIDSLALARVAREGGSYARLRLFGSLGFVVTSAGFGLSVSTVDRRTVIVALGLITACFLATLLLRARVAVPPPRSPAAAFGLLRQREVALFLAASSLHWLACAPFHGSFALHLAALGLPPGVVGLSAGLGVVAEIAVMFAYPRFALRFSPRQILAAAYGASALRWALLAVVTAPAAIVVVNLLHGLTFGAFYVASVSFMAARVPEARRASGQALFVSVTFGLGGLAGYLLAGVGYDRFGGHGLFALAAVVELLPLLLIVRIRPARPGHGGLRAG